MIDRAQSPEQAEPIGPVVWGWKFFRSQGEAVDTTAPEGCVIGVSSSMLGALGAAGGPYLAHLSVHGTGDQLPRQRAGLVTGGVCLVHDVKDQTDELRNFALACAHLCGHALRWTELLAALPLTGSELRDEAKRHAIVDRIQPVLLEKSGCLTAPCHQIATFAALSALHQLPWQAARQTAIWSRMLAHLDRALDEASFDPLAPHLPMEELHQERLLQILYNASIPPGEAVRFAVADYSKRSTKGGLARDAALLQVGRLGSEGGPQPSRVDVGCE